MSENYDYMKEQLKEIQELRVQDGFKCDEYLRRIALLEAREEELMEECAYARARIASLATAYDDLKRDVSDARHLHS